MTQTAIEAAFTAATQRDAARAGDAERNAAREAKRVARRDAAAQKRIRAEGAMVEFARLAEIRTEEIAEHQAPRHQRVAVAGVTARSLKADRLAKRNPTPIILRDALADPDAKRGGYRRADPLMRMHKADPHMVTRLHLAAARKFSEDYEVGECGASMSGGVKEFVDGGGVVDVSEHQMAAIGRYRDACDALGATLRTSVQLAALHGWSVSRIAPLMGMTQERASGWLLGGLDRLADHYFPNRATRVDAVERVLMVDADVTDVPQDRLGRGRR